MSAYMIDERHLRYLVSAAVCIDRGRGTFRWYHDGMSHELPAGDDERATEVGQMLWDENQRSINARYGDPIDLEAYLYGPHDSTEFRRFDPVQVLKACACYAYQACETGEAWQQSEAHAFIESLERRAIAMLPGYEDAAWGAPEHREPRNTGRLPRMAGDPGPAPFGVQCSEWLAQNNVD